MPDFTILEPVSAGDIIDRAIRVYRRNLTPLLGVVAVPGVIYYVSSLMFWLGYSRLLLGGGTDFGGTELLLMAAGGLGMLVWLYTLMVAVSGMARAIGDNVMAGEQITFRKCFKAASRRLGDIALMALLMIALGAGLYVALVVIVLAMVLLVGVGAALGTAVGIPPSAGGVLGVIALVLVGIAGVILMLSLVSRVIFLPQALMIEGQSAGSALGRAFKLGSKNWYKVGAIALFNYFVTISLLIAMILPVGVVLYLTNSLTPDILLKPGWNALYTAANQLTSLLVLPIWITSFTLLYFDSRVRKEGYDIEVLSLSLQPAVQPAGPYWRQAPMPGRPPYWMPPPVPMPPGYSAGRIGPPAGPPVPPSPAPRGYQYSAYGGYRPRDDSYPAGRPYVQTSPLGLAGPPPPRPQALSGPPAQPPLPATGQVPAPPTASVPPPTGLVPPATGLVARETTPAVLFPNESPPFPANLESHTTVCSSCGSVTKAGARFCHVCGKTLASGVQTVDPSSAENDKEPGPTM